MRSRSAAISTNGEDIKKEKVIAKGKPAWVKPMKIGMLEQEQNGVTVPSKAPIMLPTKPCNFPSMRLVRSGGK